ncbi:HK97 family phage prohead protease [Reyranella sp.]|uniref:HK97 family phage prohead protease n=1 Tax=Reyranella sp. TaxID=1929291 RepID=UPI0037837E88
MLFGGFSPGGLEIRQDGDGSRRLRGRFPYGRRTVLGEGKRVTMEEQFAARAFAPRVNVTGEDIHLLFGHDFSRPLASRATGTLEIRDNDDALTFDAVITSQIATTTHGRDALALMDSGLAAGLSPGFTVPDDPGAESVVREPRALIRTIRAARLWELSVVTRPAYPEGTVTARNWRPTSERADAGLQRMLTRWRA